MANSKSNIYPIQLQGAELCLNKFNAEIKQYSGFNKNNSPFVGGCLSNLFTKDTAIEDGTDNNVIIDSNNNIYKVTEEGLFKNEEKLIDTTGKDFFDVVDLGAMFAENVVYVYDETTYIYEDAGKYYYKSGDAVLEILSNTLQLNQFDFYITKKTLSGQEYEFFVIKYKSIASISLISVFFGIIKKDSEGAISYSYISTPDARYRQVTNYEKNPAYLKFNEEDNGHIRFAVFNVYNGSPYRLGKVYDFDGSTVTFIKNIYGYYRDGVNTYAGAYNLYLNSLIFTQDYIYWCNPCGWNISDPGFPVPAARAAYSVDFTDDTSKGVTIDLDGPTSETVVYAVNQRAYRAEIAKSWGVLGCVITKRDSLNNNCYSVDEDVSNGYVSGTATEPHYYVGGILNGCVLCNNGIASGISLPGGWILASEWNTVDVDFIFFGENTETWKNNKWYCLWKNISDNRWYKLVKSTPKIKEINGQIIINSNSIFNAYDIKKSKILLFAPAWNNRRPGGVTGNDSAYDNWYFASAINEYNLEDNASIIINPVPVMSVLYPPSGVSSINARRDAVYVDFYRARNSGDAVTHYFYSSAYYADDSVNNVTDTNLSGLPFPTSTDGNIQYSPSLFAKELDKFGNTIVISENGTSYELMTYNNKVIMSYFLATAIEGLQNIFTIQGQIYGILENKIFSFNISNGVVDVGSFIVDTNGLQFVGNTPYEALFFSKTNRTLYSFTGANVLNVKQLVDEISEVRDYLYNPATQTVFLLTDIGVFFYGIFGQFLLELPEVTKIYLLNNGIVMSDNEGNYKYIKYYLDAGDTDYNKQNIHLETMFYGMNNETVTINDCLYVRLFSEEHESGDLIVSASTLTNEGRKTENTTFKIKSTDWDNMTHSLYLRYQPKEQRGLGVSFSINSPFKIASLSVGSQPDAILVDKISKKAINAPQRLPSANEW